MVLATINSAAFAAEDVKTISTATLKKMIDDEADFLLIDARRSKDFDEKHIKNAISLPASDVNAKTLAELAPDVTHKLVFYCQNPKCQASHIAANISIGAGYKYVYVYGAGIDDWEANKYPVVTPTK